MLVVVGKTKSHVARIERQHRFAYELINVSRFHAREAKKAGKRNHWRIRANVISAICVSYAALEAAHNEFIHLVALSDRSPLSDEKREVIHYMASEGLAPEPKQNTLQRFNLLLRVLEKNQFDSGSEPYQSANLLRVLRNMLVHPVPSSAVVFDIADPDLSAQQEIVRRLRSRLKLGRNATFPDNVLTAECALWANQTAEAFLCSFERASGVDLGFSLRVSDD